MEAHVYQCSEELDVKPGENCRINPKLGFIYGMDVKN